jgi:RhtB (resistance to homoserine/threonine) family protein
MDFYLAGFLAWCLFAAVQMAATMSPGPAFAVSVRNVMAYGRRGGIFTALGFGVGVGAHVVFVLCGLSVVITQSVLLFSIIKYAGAAYLVYIGVKAVLSKKAEGQPQTDLIVEDVPKARISDWKAFRVGVLTNLLNPKAVVFFTAVFTQFIDFNAGMHVLALYGLTSVFIEIIWFSLLAVFLTHARIHAVFKAFAHWIERVCGGLMVALGVKLALSKM